MPFSKDKISSSNFPHLAFALRSTLPYNPYREEVNFYGYDSCFIIER
nr:MAG TPA: hypothetical protein [Caudoviricetes sp.]